MPFKVKDLMFVIDVVSDERDEMNIEIYRKNDKIFGVNAVTCGTTNQKDATPAFNQEFVVGIDNEARFHEIRDALLAAVNKMNLIEQEALAREAERTNNKAAESKGNSAGTRKRPATSKPKGKLKK